MGNLCIIPARGGSKRIPGKNIKEFLGKPIIGYSIETALSSGVFDEVMVSTDSDEIAEVARKYGAKVPFLRSNESADDFAPLSDVIEEVKADYINKFDKQFQYIACILPTAPFVNSELLKKGFNQLINNEHLDSTRPIVRFSYPIQRAVKMNEDTNVIEMFYPEHKKTRSQDLEPAFHDAGMFYWIKGDKEFLNNTKGAFEIPEIYAQDIDSLADWEVAELKYKIIQSQQNSPIDAKS